MLTAVAERALHELTWARRMLDGELDSEMLPSVPEAKDEADCRRLAAIAVIDRLSHLLIEVATVAEDTDRTLYEMAGVWELANQIPVGMEEARVFGFAAARKAG